MKILITGGAGFIGGNLVYYMLAAHPEYKIICVDCLTYAGNLSTLDRAFKYPQFKFYKANVCDRAGVYGIFEGERPDVVINLAAESHVDRSIRNPEAFFTTNVTGAQVLLDACRRYGILRFHQCSTYEVYGDLPLEGSVPAFTEESPLRASSPYSASKAAADLLTLAYYRTYGLPVTVSRCSDSYGPYQYPEKLIPLAITNAYANKSLPLYGNGLNVRDWLYVKDHCAAIDVILHKGKVGRVYNVGAGCERRNVDVLKLICAHFGRSESLIEYVPDRMGHDRRYSVDSSKVEELGWKNETSFYDGVRTTVEWYLANKSWWKKSWAETDNEDILYMCGGATRLGRRTI